MGGGVGEDGLAEYGFHVSPCPVPGPFLEKFKLAFSQEIQALLVQFPGIFQLELQVVQTAVPVCYVVGSALEDPVSDDGMEKSYQIAAKYMPQMQGQSPVRSDEAGAAERGASGKTEVVPVSQVTERTVSALQQDMSSAEIARAFSQPRNMGFFTVSAETQKESKNTISACIHDDQTIMAGQSVRLRLLEQMQAGSVIIPRSTLITGIAKIQGERLGVTVVSLEYAGIIIPVELRVYDTDGQAGVCIPNSTEINAVKEVAANMGTSAGTSISLTSDAGQQLAADLGRGVIQGTSQYVSKKLREVKVSLKAGYRVFLLPNDK